MSESSNHYQTLDVPPAASAAEIKRAYRNLAKQFHPDCNPDSDDHEKIADINVAYEVLSDPHQRRTYDRLLYYTHVDNPSPTPSPQATQERQRRTASAQTQYRRRQTGRTEDEHLERWVLQVYQPVNRLLHQILQPLREQIDDLAADPFDDELMDGFQTYLDECRATLQKAHGSFRSMPNPSTVAGVAAHLYYCINQVGDGLDELERFTSSYNEYYLHTGQELFRIARGLRREAQAAMNLHE